MQSVSEKIPLLFTPAPKHNVELFDYQLPLGELIKKITSEKTNEQDKTSAQCVLGLSYIYGLNDAVIDLKKGHDLLLEAAKHLKTPAGLCAKGVCLLINKREKLDVENDANEEEPTDYFLRAKSYEYIPAMYELAKLLYDENQQIFKKINTPSSTFYFQENTYQMNRLHCIELLKKCVDKQYALAEDLLGTCYKKGDLIETDARMSFNLYLSSAKRGSAIGKLHVAQCYADGYGTNEQDQSQAYQWLKSAIEQNYNEADIYLNKWLEWQHVKCLIS